MSEEILRIGVHELTTIRVHHPAERLVQEYAVSALANGAPAARWRQDLTPDVAVAVLCAAIDVLSKKGAPHVEFSIVTRPDDRPRET